MTLTRTAHLEPVIGVIGTGYLGTTHAACMAELGFHVVAQDQSSERIARLAAGELPFYEPDLAELVRRHTHSGRLRFTDEVADVAATADILFLCVGTPQAGDGMAADTSQVFAAAGALVECLDHDALVVGKSTVPVGTTELLAAEIARRTPPGVEVEVAWNPEFLREGHAVDDTLRPDRVVLGVSSPEAEKVLRQVYDEVIRDGAAVVVTDPATAELVKVAANAFLATKVTFANLMGELCEAAGADVTTLAESIGLDPRIGRQFLGAGLGFGGGCLPKDLRALIARADELGVDHARKLLGVVDEVNGSQRLRTVETAVELCGGSVAGVRIAALGAAFKPGTDDVRDSPALDVAARLHELGATVTVYDPHANDNARAVEPDLGFAATAQEACDGASLVVLLTEWEELVRLDPRDLRSYVDVPRMLDARNALDPQRWQLAGWEHRGFGRSSDRAQPSAGSRVREIELMQ
jgi:UDPglucose 6-dehydrogenase